MCIQIASKNSTALLQIVFTTVSTVYIGKNEVNTYVHGYFLFRPLKETGTETNRQ
jgi:hypothetical protein